MSELTALDSKIGEVLGLAQAAQTATKKIEGLIEDPSVAKSVHTMHDEAAKVEEMTTELISGEAFVGKKTAVLDLARTTKQEAVDMMRTYLGEDSDGLDGLEFLTMAEAGEVGHWKIVEKLNEQVGDRDLKELTDFVVPMQEHHFAMTMEGSLKLAEHENALAPA